MAEEKIGLEVEVKGVEQSINSIKDLKKAIKDATDEQLRASEKFGIGSKEYANASKKVSELRDKVDDLKDATKSLQGSGIERASQGFNQLGEGLRNLDFDKVKVGLTAMKSALAATGIGLIVALVSTLAEKFDIFGKITDVVTDIIYGFTDALGLTNKAAEDATKSMISNMDGQKKSIEDRYNAEIKLAKAAGKDTTDLEIKKLTELENFTKEQISHLQALATKKGGLNEDEAKQYKDLQSQLLSLSSDRQAKEIENERAKQLQLQKLGDLEEGLRVAGLSAREREIDAIKKQQESLLKELNDNHKVRLGNELNDTIRYNEDVKKINELTQNQINEVNAKYHKESLDKKKQLDDNYQAELERKAQESAARREYAFKEQELKEEEERKRSLDAQLAYMQENNLAEDAIQINRREFDRKLIESDFESFKKDKERQYNLEKNTLGAIQELSDVFFMFKKNRAEKGSKQEEELARKQFQFNKALQLGLAVIDGFKAITTSLASSPVVIGAVPNPAGIASLAFASITTAANIAKIAASQFQSSGGGAAASGASASSVPIPSPPTINTPTANTSTTFDESGQRQGNESFRMQPQKVFVVESDITDKQKRVNTIETQSVF
jgi:hypothetical protein